MRAYRETLQSIAAILSVCLSVAALVVSYQSFKVSDRADRRLQEDILFARTHCCPSDIEVAFDADRPVSLFRSHEVIISNRSAIPTTLTRCHMNSTGPGFFGIAGSNCDAEFFTSTGAAISLPTLIGPGEVVLMKFEDHWSLSDEEIAAYEEFKKSGGGSFVSYLCEHNFALRAIARLEPYYGCLVGKIGKDIGGSWITIQTGRGNDFDSANVSQL